MPYGLNPGSTNHGGARFGIQFTGANNTTDVPSLNWGDDPSKSASIYGVSEDNLGYNRKMGMAFYTSSFDAAQSERLRITNQGKVGIGISNPDSLLHIAGGSNENITLKLDPGGTAGNYSELVLGRTSSAPTIQTTPVVKGGVPISGVPGILFGSENTNLPAIGFQTPNSSNGHIVFKPKGSEKVRITSDGSFAVGTTSPDSALHVYKQINDRTARFQRISSQHIDLSLIHI